MEEGAAGESGDLLGDVRHLQAIGQAAEARSLLLTLLTIYNNDPGFLVSLPPASGFNLSNAGGLCPG